MLLVSRAIHGDEIFLLLNFLIVFNLALSKDYRVLRKGLKNLHLQTMLTHHAYCCLMI
jgi:hypothetical protein